MKGKKILIADDNAINIQLAKCFLLKWGLDISIANNGIEAYEATLTNDFDFILMDIHMPLMCGIVASQKIRSFEKAHNLTAKPIIAFTADVFIEEEVFIQNEINTTLYKPFKADDLKNLLLSFLKPSSVAKVSGKFSFLTLPQTSIS